MKVGSILIVLTNSSRIIPQETTIYVQNLDIYNRMLQFYSMNEYLEIEKRNICMLEKSNNYKPYLFDHSSSHLSPQPGLFYPMLKSVKLHCSLSLTTATSSRTPSTIPQTCWRYLHPSRSSKTDRNVPGPSDACRVLVRRREGVVHSTPSSNNRKVNPCIITG